MTRLLAFIALATGLAASPALGQTSTGAHSVQSGGGSQTHGERPHLLWPRGDWAFSMGAGTDNRSKDASKSLGDPYVSASADWEGEGGLFYAGAGAETIDAGGSDLQLEAFIGMQPELAGFDLDLSVTRQWRIDADPGADADNWEITANVSRSIGKASGRLQFQTSPDGAGATGRWTWVEARLGWTFTDRLKGTAAIGRREQQDSVDYTGWNAGVTWSMSRHLDLDLRWYDTNADPGASEAQYGSALVAAVNYAF
ncbi:TorF family putative porin [Brevundimonas goettingensis]|uniref:Porin n=1 Tax=Brevundimonas goettingensis TaxID=2774190 RepID=A0A975C4P2_9CAUL|nr:TorF family putative porin [Brevundimonas goettingensis]QTC93014.1 hypothetical protein IFJ75_09315 [Brevundimonas goettingensis]